MIFLDSTDPAVEFFKNITSILGAGLPGLAAIMIIVIGYVVIKRTDSKGILFAFVLFCAFVLVFFAYAGVGVVKQNKVLADSTKTLNKTNIGLDTTLKATTQQLTISTAVLKVQQQQNKIQQQGPAAVTAQDKDTLTKNIDSLVARINNYKAEKPNPSLSALAKQYSNVSEQLKANPASFAKTQAVLFENNRNLNQYLISRQKVEYVKPNY